MTLLQASVGVICEMLPSTSNPILSCKSLTFLSMKLQTFLQRCGYVVFL